MACKSIIKHIEAQTERIISQYEKLEEQCHQLREERDALRSQVREQEEQLRELKAEVQRLRLAEGLSGNKTDKAKSRARINLLLREVDKCIALLTKAQEN
ncbi:MAG: hypothetical protein IJN45_01465 [Alistipes sp.]|nr:hypothetical protein [Alistipes sp.]MBQ3196616.1 hypothetical protein [Alistipes sp.]MBQ4533418.1 hypothetical protein [Alistipes sp.]MBQ6987796.1 hypothetical protein [Alistipes sp.]MBR2008345.1 hypothetical protein [Alistipes sp.]